MTDSMTPQAQIEYLATKVMGWEHKPLPDSLSDTEWWWERGKPTEYVLKRPKKMAWNPLADWNHWRQVEERMLNDDSANLIFAFLDILREAGEYTDAEPEWVYMDADLPARVSALIAVHQELYPSAA
jgi:hypothetical protein